MSTTVATLSLPEDLEFAELRLEIDLDNERSASARGGIFSRTASGIYRRADHLCPLCMTLTSRLSKSQGDAGKS